MTSRHFGYAKSTRLALELNTKAERLEQIGGETSDTRLLREAAAHLIAMRNVAAPMDPLRAVTLFALREYRGEVAASPVVERHKIVDIDSAIDYITASEPWTDQPP